MPIALKWIPNFYNFGTYLDFEIQPQQQTQWCWSAVAVSVSHFYWTWSGWDQCEMVNAEFGQTTCCDDGSTSQCNQPWYTANALTRTKNYKQTVSGTLTREQILAQLEAGNVIATRIGWSGGGGHAMVIYGFNPVFDWLYIGDPWYGNQVVDYDTYATAYQGSGTWTHTYLTKSYIPILEFELELMPIFTKFPPPYVTRILERDLSELLRPEQTRAQSADAVRQPENLRVHTTHPVYTVSLVNAQRSILSDAEITTWRSLVSDSDTPLASIDVRAADERAVNQKISAINEGPFVQSLVETLNRARELGSVREGDFELRVLEIPSLYVRAVWLKNASERGDDLVIPLSPAPTALEPGREYSEREFNKIVADMSRERLRRDDDELVG